MSFDYTAFFRQDLPPAANAFSGFPQYNFVGGHNDADSVPVTGLVDALSTAMKKDGRHLASGGDKIMNVWDAASGKGIYKLEGHEQGVFSVAWSPDGSKLASGSEESIMIWSIPK